MTVKQYIVAINHQSSIIKITTTATSWLKAVEQCLSVELAPVSTVLYVEERAL